jgi:hypothetical protein
MAGYPARRACQEYWQLHIQAALERGTLPVLLISNEHFLPKMRRDLWQQIRACERRLAECTARLAEEDHPPIRRDLETLIDYYQKELAKARAQSPDKPFRNQPIVPVYPLFVLNAHLQCIHNRRLFGILQSNGVPYYPVKGPDGHSIVWVVPASPKLEEVFNSYALRRNKKPLKLTSLAYPLIDISLLPEEHRSLNGNQRITFLSLGKGSPCCLGASFRTLPFSPSRRRSPQRLLPNRYKRLRSWDFCD